MAYGTAASNWSRLRAAGAVVTALAMTLAPAGLALAGQDGSAPAGSLLSGTLYFTRFCSPTGSFSPNCGSDANNVGKVAFTYDGTNFALGTAQDVAQVPAADGLALLPDHNLLVGGQFTGDVYDVNPSTGTYTSTPAGTPSAFMIGLSPDGQTAYIGSVGDGSNGNIGVVGLTSAICGSATVPCDLGTIQVSGPDQNVDAIAFANGQAYYTSSLPDAPGDFGEINLSTGAETRLLTGLPAAHGMTYDPYTGDLILSGMHEIVQIDPTNPTQIAGSLSVNLGSGYYDVYDLPWADGQGHLFAAANDGQMTFIDYAATGNLSTATQIDTVTVSTYLDDVVGVLTSPAGCTGSTSDPDQNGDVHSNNHNGHGEDVAGQESGGSGAGQGCCASEDPDHNGDVQSNNHNGHGEDVSGTDQSGQGQSACDPDSNGDVHSNNHNGHGEDS